MVFEQHSFKQNPDFVEREIAGEYILVPTGDAALSFNGLASLNSTGKFIWLYLAEKRTFEEICDALAKEYELTEEQSRTDVTDYLELALCRNLVLQY